MVFVDSNVPMYLVGDDDTSKGHAVIALHRLIETGTRLVTSAEVYQEVLHRYVAIDRRDAIGPAFDLLSAIVDEVFPIQLEDVLRAREVVDELPRLSSRDALHIAVMERAGVTRVLSYDRGFDAWEGIARES